MNILNRVTGQVLGTLGLLMHDHGPCAVCGRSLPLMYAAFDAAMTVISKPTCSECLWQEKGAS